jgi:glycine cleavage system aminomethyltransferase T/glycine/D-amino acid oxidase-like deaminating enzyme
MNEGVSIPPSTLQPRPSTPSQAQVVIVGGGIVGASAAYHLAAIGMSDVVLLEQNQIGGGTTWHAAGMVTRLRSSAAMAVIHDHSARLYASLPAETGVDTGWKQVGSLYLARSRDRITQNRRAAAMAKLFGIDSHEISLDELRKIWPMMRIDDLVGALWIPEDGRTEPASTARALAKGAEMRGATVIEGVRVLRLLADGHRATGVVTDQGEIAAESVLLCGGMWMRQFGLDHGIDLPLHPVEHHYAVTKPVEGVHDMLPCTRDHDGSLYIRSEGAQMVVGAFQPGAKPWNVERVPDDFSFNLLEPDWPSFDTALVQARRRFADFDSYGFDRFVNGPESFTPDTNAIVGPVVGWDGLYACAGFNSFGIAGAGGMGKAIAEWIAAGEEPMDLWEVDSRRFASHHNEAGFLSERVSEVLGHHYDIAWPTHEFHSGRGLRRSPFHRRFEESGACFGQRMGWERPLWFAGADRTPTFDHSWGRATWFAHWATEHRAAREAVALFDQSSFGKLRVSGPDALRLLNRVSANEIDVDCGRLVYTAWLNRNGRFVSDLTIVRHGPDDFAVMTAAIQPVHDRDWLERVARAMNADAQIEDVTDQVAVIGVMGPNSRALLHRLTNADLGNTAFPFASIRQIAVSGIDLVAQRVTYVGELGWELHIPAAQAVTVLDALIAAGADSGVTLAGTMAMNSLRMEKAYVSWSHDVSRDDTPLEAGLGFAVAWDKPGGFIGREALARQRAEGARRRLITFVLDDPEPLLWGHEPILRDGQPVGYTTSGSYGHTLGAAVGMGYVSNGSAVSREWIEAGRYEIDIAGELFGATPHWRAPYDPSRKRILA